MKAKLTTLLFVQGLSTQALAGGWFSTGGDLFKDAHNPWFIQSTKSVSYCIEIDEDNFGISKERAKEIIAESFAYWKRTFSEAQPTEHQGFGTVKLATQEFKYSEYCYTGPMATDLIFLLGKFINREQEEFITNSREHVGVAVRTHYSKELLRGNGFIYISPERGPLSFVDESIRPNPWSEYPDQRLLRFVVLHELGHVFGVQHQGTWVDFMSARFPESIVTNPPSPMFDFVSRLKWPPDFAKFNGEWRASHCSERLGYNRPMVRFFGIPEDWQCMKLETNARVLHVYASRTGMSGEPSWEHIGSANLEDRQQSTKIVSELYITNEQGVFPGKPGPLGLIMHGPSILLLTWQGIYRQDTNRDNGGLVRLSLKPNAVREFSYQSDGILHSLYSDGTW